MIEYSVDVDEQHRREKAERERIKLKFQPPYIPKPSPEVRRGEGDSRDWPFIAFGVGVFIAILLIGLL